MSGSADAMTARIRIRTVGAIMYPVIKGYFSDPRNFMIVVRATKSHVYLVPISDTRILLSDDGTTLEYERKPIVPATLPPFDESTGVVAKISILDAEDGLSYPYANFQTPEQLQEWGVFTFYPPFTVKRTYKFF